MQEEDQLYHQSGAFVRFLSSWSSSDQSLAKRIATLARDIARAGFWQWREVDIIDAWLADLHSIGYRFPSIAEPKKENGPIKNRRAAICVTGIAECIDEGWKPTYLDIRSRLQGDIDTFLFISSSAQHGPVPLTKRLKQIRSYMNSTVTIVFEDRAIDPHIPADCHPRFQLPRHSTFPVPGYFQQLWALNECFDLVKTYEQQFNIRYQLFIRARIDTLAKMPSTFERQGPLNVNTSIIVPPHRYFPGIDDGFALGPMQLMSYYMKRWLSFQQCPPDRNLHPETYLKNYLSRFTNVTVDAAMSGAADAIPHGPSQYH
jgi:hypothetical protein